MTCLASSSVSLLLAISRCNRFALYGVGDSCAGTVMSYGASLFNHNCVPNTAVLIEKNTLTFRTLTRVESGTELCISYLNLTHIESLRRQELRDSYFFTCSCSLCAGDEAAKEMSRKELVRLTCTECEGLVVPIIETKTCVCRNCYRQTVYQR